MPLQPRCRTPLQRDRRLGFFSLPHRQAEHPSRRVKPAPRARADRTVQATHQHRFHALRRRRPDHRRQPRPDLVTAPQRMQHRRDQPPRLPRRHIATGQRQRRQVREPIEPAVRVQPQQLAAPGRPVRAQPDAVQRQPEQRSVQPALGLHHREVRVVVLHADGRHAEPIGPVQRQPRAVEIRVQVVRDGVDRPARVPHQRLDRRLQRRAGVRRA